MKDEEEIKARIEKIVDGLKQSNFENEAQVSQGIVLPLLKDLGWDIFNPNEVFPEYPRKKVVEWTTLYAPSLVNRTYLLRSKPLARLKAMGGKNNCLATLIQRAYQC